MSVFINFIDYKNRFSGSQDLFHFILDLPEIVFQVKSHKIEEDETDKKYSRAVIAPNN
jgi:hypothetical protein